ncbi:MAG: aspartyl protease family protein [Proteobacteria bacterium]|nr:aspartyl protease family protein [Pseudomonadota bacterium]
MTISRRQAAASLLSLAATPAFPAFAQPAFQTGSAAAPGADDAPTQVDSTRDGYEHMLAPVTINGQGPFQFLMDTGANTSCISRDLAQRLMLAAVTAARIHTVVGVRERPGVLIDHLQVGQRARRSVRAAALPLTTGIDGVLGVDWLEGQRLVLDFKARNIAIVPSVRDETRNGSVVVPARRHQGQLTIVDADLSGRPVSAMIDSGSQMTIGNDALRQMVAADNRRTGRADDYPVVTLETIAGESFSGELMYLPFLRLGGLRMGNVPVVHANMHVFDIWGLKDKPAMVLGMDLLTQFDRVALDYGRSRVRFDLSEAQLDPGGVA